MRLHEKSDHAVVPQFGPDHPMRLLYVEDSPLDARLFIENLKRTSFGAHVDMTHVDCLSDACAAVADQAYDCVLLDLGLPDGVGAGNVSRVLRARPGVTIVVMTGDDSEASGLQAIHSGAQEYLVKGQVEMPTIIRILRHAVQRNQLLQELKDLREREYFMATHDPLTKLPNRQLFEDRTRQMLLRAERNEEQLAICYLDLDGFKPVNDTFGHATGDLLLRAVADCLSDVVRDSDTVARVGGDEFVLVLYPLDGRAETDRIAQRIIERVQKIQSADGNPVSVSTSIGISLYPEHGTQFKELVHNADVAMYHSKHRQRGGYDYFSFEMLGEASQHRALIEELNEGLRLAQFSADYQPWLDIESGQVQGVEALLRWRDASGVRHPGLFLAAAQESGLILQIAREVHKACCNDWHQWRTGALNPGQLALNLTSRELSDPDYLDELPVLAESLELPRDEIQLHIDVRDAARMDKQALRTALTQLESQHYRLVLDRVASDDASQSLMQIPEFDEFRFQASALIDADGQLGSHSADFVTQVIDHGVRRQANVVAVGIETDEQASQLKALGVRYMQGYLYSAPVVAQAVPELLRR